jgi:hypothetical protein
MPISAIYEIPCAHRDTCIKPIRRFNQCCFCRRSQCPFQIRPAFWEWARTPPMGWNSWDSFGTAVSEAEVKAQAKIISCPGN